MGKLSWILAVAALCIISATCAEVVVFNSYETESYLQKDKLLIERAIVLQNVGSNPIIPGELHFKLHEIRKGEKVASEVSNLQAANDLGRELKSRQVETVQETDLVVSVWEPVLPKFTYKVLLSYDLRFRPKGLFFYEIKVPVEQTTIPIRDNRHSLYLPAKYHVTYAPGAEVTTVQKGSENLRKVTWSNREDMLVEYSRLPLPKMGIRAVNVFWAMIIAILLASTFVIHRRIRRG